MSGSSWVPKGVTPAMKEVDQAPQYENAESMWQSINRYFGDLDGIEKVGHGKWDADLSEL